MLNPNLLPEFAFEHLDGDAIVAPQFDLVAAHPFDEWPLPGPGNPKLKLPCVHLRLQQRATGVELGRTPCRHLVPELVRDNERHIIFHTDTPKLRAEVLKAVDKLAQLGVTMGTVLRPLRIYNRPLAPAPHGQDGSNPCWSRYHRGTHAINVHHDPVNATAQFLDTLHHELGHATLGHSAVRIDSPGGSHDIDSPSHPALAMSEGWGHFVALAIRHGRGDVPGGYSGRNWENRPASLPRDVRIESNVALALWDLFDLPTDERPGHPPLPLALTPDPVRLSFARLFAVYSPSLNTLQDGPLINSIDEYLSRLKQLQPADVAGIDKVRQMHFG